MKKIIFILSVVMLSGCYTFKNASIPAGLKTVEVPLFENIAPLVDPTLSNTFTEDFKERIRTQSKLSISKNDAQAKFEGKITDYDIKPISIQDNARPIAGANRLTITVMVKYTVNLKGSEKQSFPEQAFTAYTDFSLAGQSLASQQKELNKKVIVQLTENIFNKAFAQW